MKRNPISGPVRLAIIGAGGMANTHARNFGAIRGCKVVAAVEPAADRREAFCETHKIPAGFATVDELHRRGED